MKIAPFRHLLLLLVLAALPAAAFANCCVCDRNGTYCSACCWEDQAEHCVTFIDGVAPPHCGCYCDPAGDGGGGGGGVGCSVAQTHTSAMGVHRADRGAKAEHQLRFGLSRSEKRRDGVYVFEEWAVISAEGNLLGASNNVKFAQRAQEEGFRFRPARKASNPNAAALVIEEAEHPANSRQIPLPSVAPIAIDADYTASLAGQEIWFRVEVGKDGVVDQVLLVNVPDDLVAGRFATELHLLNGELGKALKLRYAEEGRHRIVVFGSLRADFRGHLVMNRSRVLLPKCCCNGAHCN